MTEEKKKQYETDDAKEISEVFSALNESIPKLISGLIGSVYSPESAASMAEAIGIFYTKLIEQGIPQDLALEMTRKYVGALDFGKIMSMANGETIQVDTRRKHQQDDEE
ncbi:MAG: hypothetical protein BAJATHORv1_40015 [Candidatus Thorarchaeota archaeon]|nr:MAG: hypothetical protein BAJATHORv1_40015 [Candidatus Thorarchaeota archaeon]